MKDSFKIVDLVPSFGDFTVNSKVLSPIFDKEANLIGWSSWGRLYGVQTGSPTNNRITFNKNKKYQKIWACLKLGTTINVHKEKLSILVTISFNDLEWLYTNVYSC